MRVGKSQAVKTNCAMLADLGMRTGEEELLCMMTQISPLQSLSIMPPPIVMCLRVRPLRGSIFARSGDGMARDRPVGTLVLLLGGSMVSVRHAMS